MQLFDDDGRYYAPALRASLVLAYLQGGYCIEGMRGRVTVMENFILSAGGAEDPPGLGPAAASDDLNPADAAADARHGKRNRLSKDLTLAQLTAERAPILAARYGVTESAIYARLKLLRAANGHEANGHDRHA